MLCLMIFHPTCGKFVLGTEYGCDRKGFQCWNFSQPILRKRQLARQQSASENKLKILIPETNANICALDVSKQP